MQTIHVSTEPGGILLLTFNGEVKDAGDVAVLKSDIAIVSKTIQDLHKKSGKGIKILIDLSDFKADFMDEAVEALADLARQDQAFVQKTASFGGSLKIRTIGKTIVALAGRKNIMFFQDKSEALDWLNA
jgi:hypothetical protein